MASSETGAGEAGHLQRHIGLIGLTFVAVSGIIGSGWLFAPLNAAQAAGPAALIAWLIGGVAMLLLALTFAEVSAMLPVPGGIARVPQFSHGNVVSMAMGFSAWIGYCTNAPIEVEAMLTYMAPYAPWLHVAGSTAAEPPLSVLGMVVVAVLLVLFVIINAIGVRFFTYVNSTITWGKVVLPLAIAGLFLFSQFNSGNFTIATSDGSGFAPYGFHGILTAVTAGGIIFSFIGFRHAIDMAGETKNPKFTVPAALILSIVICFVIYGALQIAFIGALTPDQLSGGWATLQIGHDIGPLGGIAVALGILWLISLLNVAAVIFPFAGGLVAFGSNARLAYAMSQNGLFPKIIQYISSTGVPLTALLLNLVVAVVMYIFLPFQEILKLNGAAITLSFVVGPLAVVVLRRLLPHQPRSFKLPAVHVIAALAFIIATMVVYWSGWDTIWRLGVGLLFGAVLLFIQANRQHRAADWAEAVWLLPYFIGIGVISYLGDFGEGALKVIPFGWDMVVLTVFSLAIFIWAIRSALTEEKLHSYLDEEIGHDLELHRKQQDTGEWG